MKSGKKPVLAILGGAKFLQDSNCRKYNDVVDHIIIGGGMSFTFVKALGGSIGNSIHEDEMINTALDILQLAKNKSVKIHLPVDVLCSTEFSNDGDKTY